MQLDRVFAERPGTTGFVVQNKGAIGPLLTLLRTGGRAVPEDASVVALCPKQLAEQQTPALTSVSGPATELGRAPVEQVLRRLDAASQDTAPEDERVLPAPTLTVRQGTGPAELS
jgi:DNA-binding LacI/PurR family transcriptional regulator